MGFTDDTQIGLIAQEVEPVMAELVNTDEDGYKSLAYDKLSAVLVEATKELHESICELRNENKLLKERIEVLESR